MFSGSFRAQLNSRSRRRASVLATTAVALHPYFPLLQPVARLCMSHQVYRPIEGRRVNLSCPYFVRCRSCSQLSCYSLGTAARAFITCRSVGSIQDVDCPRFAPVELRGKGEFVLLRKKDVGEVSFLSFEQID